MAVLLDQLWQTVHLLAWLSLFAVLNCRNSGRFRVWIWRAAALKIFIPLQLLCLLGGAFNANCRVLTSHFRSADGAQAELARRDSLYFSF